MSQQALQHPNWCFTFNYGGDGQPPVEAAERFLNDVLPPLAGYLCCGREVASTGQKHLQGYVQFLKRKRLTELKRLPDAGTVHWEVAKGDEVQNREYCSKECADDEFFEYGEPKTVNNGIREKKRWAAARSAILAGRVEDVDDQIFICHYNALLHIARDYAKPSGDLDDVCGVWYYGPSGTGKSRTARATYGGGTDRLYLKPVNKWWDGFRKGLHENVLLEDVEPSHSVLGYHFKIWADRYSFPAEIKGSTIQIRPKKVIVTSQYHPDQIFQDPETLQAILRRFVLIHVTSAVNVSPPDAFDATPGSVTTVTTGTSSVSSVSSPTPRPSVPEPDPGRLTQPDEPSNATSPSDLSDQPRLAHDALRQTKRPKRLPPPQVPPSERSDPL